jgi:hypothetical protein
VQRNAAAPTAQELQQYQHQVCRTLCAYPLFHPSILILVRNTNYEPSNLRNHKEDEGKCAQGSTKESQEGSEEESFLDVPPA